MNATSFTCLFFTCDVFRMAPEATAGNPNRLVRCNAPHCHSHSSEKGHRLLESDKGKIQTSAIEDKLAPHVTGWTRLKAYTEISLQHASPAYTSSASHQGYQANAKTQRLRKKWQQRMFAHWFQNNERLYFLILFLFIIYY